MRSVGKYVAAHSEKGRLGPERPANGFAGRACGGDQRLQNQGIIGSYLTSPLRVSNL